MELNLPFVSIIIPCRNEEKYIRKCLDSIVFQDYPKDKLEVLIMDGMSEDGTQNIIKDYCRKFPFIKFLENPEKFTPFGLNIGAKEAKGEIIMRMDAHAGYEKDYISKCVKYLQEYKADNVGGIIRTIPANNTPAAKAIAASLSSRLGVASFFRLGSEKSRWVDTVFGGCYRCEVFKKIGYFDERMIRSQDIEFNKRLVRAGGKILLIPEITAAYYPQSNFSGFLKHNFEDGFWVTFPLKFGIKYFSLRHLIPLFFTSIFLIGFVFGIFFFWIRIIFDLFFLFYFIANFLFSFYISFKIGIIALPYIMASFFIRHFFYGLGSIWGLIKIVK
ncbi:MAG: glycosyltransferase family 2 protein [Patescibacteria group bacterium]